MKKRAAVLLLALAICISALPVSVFAAEGLSNFIKVAAYADGQFADLPENGWYNQYVKLAYELNLVNGKSENSFAPDADLSIAEAIKLATCMHRIYYTGTNDLQNGEPWYQTYVDYALENGIIESGYLDYNTPALRSDFAKIFANALPAEALTPVNTVDDDAVPDVRMSYSYAPSVYLLYRAGVLGGSDDKGTFYPNNRIKRSEVAAIVVRMVDTGSRISVTLTTGAAPTSSPAADGSALTAAQISEICSPAVFYIEVFNSYNEMRGSGSGFFIDESGIAVTNYHVIKGAKSAKVTMPDGSSYDVAGVCDYDEVNDLAILKINGGNPFPYLKLGDSQSIKSGEAIYTISSPLGLQNSITSGIVSNPARTFEEDPVTYFQIDAAISPGSSGGALINTKGEVVGVTSAYVIGGQNTNLAVPIHLLQTLKREQYVTLQSMRTVVAYYDRYYGVPDFGAYAGMSPYEKREDLDYAYYFYSAEDNEAGFDALMDKMEDYLEILEEYGYEYAGSYYDKRGWITYVYKDDKHTLLFGPDNSGTVYGLTIVILPVE